MIFHSGDKELWDRWQAGELEYPLIQLTVWQNNVNSLHFATELLDRDKIPWFCGTTGKRYAILWRDPKYGEPQT